MTRNFLLSAASAVLFLSTAAHAGIGDPVKPQEQPASIEAGDSGETDRPVTRARIIQIPRAEEPATSATPAEPMQPAKPMEPTPAKLVSFDGTAPA